MGSVAGARLPSREESRWGCWGMAALVGDEVVNAEITAGKRKRLKLGLHLNF